LTARERSRLSSVRHRVAGLEGHCQRPAPHEAVHHGRRSRSEAQLLLKERLRRVQPARVWEEVDR
jgi:hypothetical protein